MNRTTANEDRFDEYTPPPLPRPFPQHGKTIKVKLFFVFTSVPAHIRQI
jgi:hypothetical protein